MWNSLAKDKQKLEQLAQLSFSAIDFNDDGKIQRNELEEILISTAEDIGVEKPSKEDIKEIFKQLDQEGKGFISKQNFSVLILQILKLFERNEQIV